MTCATHAAVAAAVVLGFAGAAPARAQVSCGDVIGPNETVTLEGDVDGCGPGAAALTVIGPATLDLNGFSVICAPSASPSTGIVVVGKRARVRNGSVQLCGTGVELLGEGAHQIEGVIAALSDSGAGSRGEGFVIESDRNRLTGNSAVQNSAEGFRIVEGNRNQLIDNNAFFNEIGFQILIGQRNVLEGNRAGDNDVFGFHLDGGPFVPGGGRNSLKENTATGNSTGFSLDSELATRLTSNVASENERDGIEVFFGDRNRLTGNRVEDNGESGIVIASSRNAVIRLNTSLNNDRAADDVRSFDMLDSLSDCGTSRWLGNVFVTSNESCIR